MSSRGQNTHFALQMFVLSIWTISGRMGERSRPVASSSFRIGFAWLRSIDSAARRAVALIFMSVCRDAITRVRISSSSTVGS